MSNYRRLISYIYAYEGGVKGKNIGFAKIEIRNGQCRIHVNVKRIFLGNSDIGVYLLSPQKEILLGRLFVRNGTGEFRVNVNAGDVENSGCSMEQCYGLTIHETESTWRTYTTIWEDAVTQAAEVELADVTAERMKGLSASEVRPFVSEEIQQELEQENAITEAENPMPQQENPVPQQEDTMPDQDSTISQQGGAEQENSRKEFLSGTAGEDNRETAGADSGEAADTDSREAAVTNNREAADGDNQEAADTDKGEAAEADSQNTDGVSQTGMMQEEQNLSAGTADDMASKENRTADTISPEMRNTAPEDAETEEGWRRGSTIATEQNKDGESQNQGTTVNGKTPESITTENPMRSGRDSVSEKVLRIAKAFVQGRNAGAEPGMHPGSGTAPQGARQDSGSKMLLQGAVQNPENAMFLQGTGQIPEKGAVRQERGQTPRMPEPGDPARLAELDRQEQEEMERDNVWRQLQRRYPKVLAFDYANGCEILSIKPQDIGILPRENWVYGNNSFLLHGYYNYRHLILARLENPGGEPRYLLGVPGHYYSNEKNLAAMFGFPLFVLAKKQPEQDGRFGYWYTDLRL